MRKQDTARLRVRVSDRSDPWIFGAVCLLVLTGFVFVLDTTYFYSQEKYDDAYWMVVKHGISVVLGAILMWGLSRIPTDRLEAVSGRLFLFATALLVLPMVPGLGSCANGACRWVDLGPFNLQPAEALKLAFVIYLASALSRKSDRLADFRYGVLPTLAVMLPAGLLLLLQPDFGTAVLIAVLGVALMFLAGVPLRQLALLALPLFAAMAVLINEAPYRLKRFLCFLDTAADPQGACYQLIQSFRTFGSGQFTGTGIGSSRMKTGLLPEAHTDFIFSVVGEEAGVLGACLVLLCFCVLAYRGFRVAHRHPDSFGQMLAAGITLALVSQALINIGVVLGLLPTKGLALPFMSYGGSSMMVSLACVGVLMSLSRELRER